jgi:hypothetical protein
VVVYTETAKLYGEVHLRLKSAVSGKRQEKSTGIPNIEVFSVIGWYQVGLSVRSVQILVGVGAKLV